MAGVRQRNRKEIVQLPSDSIITAGVKRFSATIVLLLSLGSALAGKLEDYADRLAPLIDPAKLVTLGERRANPRIQKSVYWLVMAKQDRTDPAKVIDLALVKVRMTNSHAAELTKAALLRNIDIAEKLECLDVEGMAEMRKGNAATVKRGPYKGDQLSVDHIIPRSVVPELDNVIANLELMPARMNSQKNSKIGQRQRDLAIKFNNAALLSAPGLAAVLNH
jgi:hypothetical protein